MNETLFSETIHSEQFQVGQSNVKHVTYGLCEIKEIEVYQGKIYYKIRVISTNMILKCISTKLSLMEVNDG
jgi:hypothetical protein